MIFDNFSNCSRDVPARLEQILGCTLQVVDGDIPDALAVYGALEGLDALIHFAALKAMGQSVEFPLEYHANYVGGFLNLLKAIDGKNVREIVFPISATVYGEPNYCMIDEGHSLWAINPYGTSKLVGEMILSDLTATPEADWSVTLLRYFNPLGAHESGLTGEVPQNSPDNLMPLIVEAVQGKRDKLSVFGADYDTPDGTAVRDYIHVMDLAEGHVAALEAQDGPGVEAVNLGTGKGSSVCELISAFADVNGVKVPSEGALRRPGDARSVFAKADLLRDKLGWQAKRDLDAMCADAWRFASR